MSEHVTTLVTGSNRRIGKAIADACLARGEHVVLHSRAKTNATVPERCTEWLWDMTEPLVDLPTSSVDHLVLNASIFEKGLSWNTLKASDRACELATLERHLRINVVAQWELAVALSGKAPLQSIVILLDSYFDRAFPLHASYLVSRAAGVGLVRALALELAPSRVNGVAPGTVLPSTRSHADHAENADEVAARTLMGRMGDPEDVVAAVMFLREAKYVTGEVLRVDGGRFRP